MRVGPNQINVRIPWEMQGQTAAQMAVKTADTSVAYTIPLSAYLPEMFAYGDHLAIAQDEQ